MSNDGRGRDAFSLGLFGRIVLFVLAVLSAATAIYFAFFDPEVGEAVIVAFLAAALLLGLTGATGRLPSAFGLGGATASYSKAEEAVQKSQNESPEEKRKIADELVSDLGPSAERDSRVAAAAVIRLESFVEEAVIADLNAIDGINVMTTVPEVRVSTPGRGAPLRLDAVIERNGKRWAVEISSSGTSNYMSPLERLTRAIDHGHFEGGILITPNGSGWERYMESKKIRIIEVGQLASRLPEDLDQA